MNKLPRTVFSACLSLALAAAFVPAARAHCGHCGMGESKDGKAAASGEHAHHAKHEGRGKHECGESCELHGNCPAHVEGADISVTDSADGVTIVIKGKDAEAVKKIQASAKKMAKGECCAGHGHKGHSKGKKEKKGGK